jgi:hypothetical protein
MADGLAERPESPALQAGILKTAADHRKVD